MRIACAYVLAIQGSSRNSRLESFESRATVSIGRIGIPVGVPAAHDASALFRAGVILKASTLTFDRVLDCNPSADGFEHRELVCQLSGPFDRGQEPVRQLIHAVHKRVVHSTSFQRSAVRLPGRKRIKAQKYASPAPG